MAVNQYRFRCEGCGHSETRLFGPNVFEFYKTDFPAVAKAGHFGEYAKKIVSEGPVSDISIAHFLYGCECGHKECGVSMIIRREGKRTYSTPHICTKCGRRMRRLGIPSTVRCNKCAGVMSRVPNSLDIQ